MNYTIVNVHEADGAIASMKMIDIVKDLIEQGWKPEGGVAAVKTINAGCELFQAMIKD